MHILQFSFGGTTIPAIHGGAVQQIIEELSREFVNYGHKVTVITNANVKDKNKLETFARDGVNYQYIYTKDIKAINTLIYIKAIVDKIIENGPYDIIHIHHPILINIFKMLSSKIGNPKIIWHVHNRSRFSFFARNQKINIVGVSKSVLRGINKFITGNNLSVIQSFINNKKFPLLIDEKRIKIRTDLGIKDDKFVIGFAGRISPEKGIHVLLSALDYLDEQELEKITVLMVGSSWFKDADKTKYELEMYKESKKHDINWLGYIDNWELYKFYNACDLFVVPSTWEEPAGLVVIEAQSCGTKVLAADIGGIPEYLSPYESTFKAGDAKDLSFKLKAEINGEKENNNKKNSRTTWIKEKLNVKEIVNQWISLYEEE